MHFQPFATFFLHSAVLSVPAVLWRKLPISGLDDNVNTQQQLSYYLHLLLRCSLQPDWSVFPQTWRMPTRWNNGKRITIALFTFKWPFLFPWCWSCRRHCQSFWSRICLLAAHTIISKHSTHPRVQFSFVTNYPILNGVCEASLYWCLEKHKVY